MLKMGSVIGLLFVVAAGLPAAQSGGSATVGATPSAAPLNPDFLQGLAKARQSNAMTIPVPGAHTLGLIPNPIDLSHLMSQPAYKAQAATMLPASYDLRTLGRVTPVKDQGNCGSCWAFATFGSMESALSLTAMYDFSENNLKDLSGFDLGPCSGGNGFMSMAYLSRWAGPVDEAEDPYNATSTNTSVAGLIPEKHVRDVMMIPGRGSALSNDALKNAVMTYGGIETFMLWSDGAYNVGTAGYYYSGSGGPNHAITLVGWDDNYSSKNFLNAPAGNGAFLCKNSWGTFFGQSGYFWISYYDTVYALNSTSFAFYGDDPITTYSRQYEYDPLGWVSNYGYGNSTASFANVFTAVATEPLQAVAFYAPANNTSYSISIYTGVTGSPTTGTLAETMTGVETYAGYHTVVLPQAVTVTNGKKFSVAVTVTTPGYQYPVAVEYAVPGYTSAAVASPGQSYVSPDGKSWTDLTTWQSTANVCLKALTAGGSTATPGFTLTAGATTATVVAGSSTAMMLSTVAQNGFQAAVSLSVSGLPSGMTGTFAPASIASPGNGNSSLTLAASSATAAGTYTLTVTASGGGVTKTQTMTLTVSLPPSFTLTSAATTATVVQGGSTSLKLTTAVLNGFQSAVALSVSGLPTGISGNFVPASIASPGSGSSTLTLAATSAAAAGSYTLTITAIGGGLTKTQAISLTVSLPPSFTLTSAATAATILQGGSTSIKLTTAALNGFQSAVAFTVSGLPTGISGNFAPGSVASPGSGSSTLTLGATSVAAAGSYTLTLTASGGGVTKTQPIGLTVSMPPSFTLTPAATAATVVQGGSTSIKLTTAALNGFQSAVALAVTGLPAGATASFAPASLASPGSGSSTLTFTTTSAAAAGSYTLTLTASGGGVTKTQPISLTVSLPPNFMLTPAATAATVVQGGVSSIKLTTAALNGFQSAVALTVSGLPTGVTASFAPASLASPGSGSSTLTFAATSAAAAGSYTLTITAIGGGLTKTQAISLTVSLPPNFTLTPAATAATVVQGGSTSIKLTTAALNGFQSAIALTVTGLPAGVTASFASASIASPGSGTSTLTLAATSAATAGSYTVTLTAGGGGVTKTQPIGVTVSIPPSFTLKTSAATATLARGASTTIGLATTAINGFQSAVSLSAVGLPPGVTATFVPASIAAPGNGDSTLTLSSTSTTSAVAAGSFTLTATGGGVTKTQTISLTVSTSATH